MKRAGFDSLDAVVDKVFEPHEFPLMAQRGDLAFLETPEGGALGVIGMDGATIISIGPDGFSRVPIHAAKRAWSVF